MCELGYDAARGSFTQSFGSPELDASLLLIPAVGFLPIEDPRVAGTIAAIERELVTHGFVLRYRTESGADGLPAGEGVFLACASGSPMLMRCRAAGMRPMRCSIAC